jgi:predicted nucleic acid-binding protein
LTKHGEKQAAKALGNLLTAGSCLDTSVISHLEQPEKPFEQKCSQILFSRIRNGEFKVYLSKVVIDEIDNCPQPRQEKLKRHISEIDFIYIEIIPEIENLAKKIIERKVLPPRSIRDSQHIAAAIYYGCDYILSWNMKHMAHFEINKGIRLITTEDGYKEIMLWPPLMFTDGRVYDD